jgi:hypothetical protein
MPGNPIKTEIGNQDAFLVEIRSISGFSGSPVFALIPHHRDTFLPLQNRLKLPVGGIGGKERILFVGIDCGHMTYLDQGVYTEVMDQHGNKHLQETKLWTNVNTGMAIVIGAWKLDELLNTKEFKIMREDENRRRRKAVSHTKLDYSTTRPRLQNAAPLGPSIDPIWLWLKPLLDGRARLNQIDEVSCEAIHAGGITDRSKIIGTRGLEGANKTRLKVRNVLLKNDKRRFQDER